MVDYVTLPSQMMLEAGLNLEEVGAFCRMWAAIVDCMTAMMNNQITREEAMVVTRMLAIFPAIPHEEGRKLFLREVAPPAMIKAILEWRDQ
ncbi:MAG: hypothetical protein HRJ53_03030 [Acidobacteria bacterium Pan2503]|uniref:Uncharacterized protein n=1 Tax=Candidatus Acidiferrum panamense TaxID=2741543 RepID=A0A7V8NMD9_9BACT|nr:hypothetical protein [Candidatus Acidoferrum panamensis]